MRTRNISIPAENKVPAKLGRLPKRFVLQSQRTGRPPSWVFPEPLPHAEIPFLQTACLFSMNKL